MAQRQSGHANDLRGGSAANRGTPLTPLREVPVTHSPNQNSQYTGFRTTTSEVPENRLDQDSLPANGVTGPPSKKAAIETIPNPNPRPAARRNNQFPDFTQVPDDPVVQQNQEAENAALPFNLTEMNLKNSKGAPASFDLSNTVKRIVWSTFGILVVCVVALVALKRLGFRGGILQRPAQGGQIMETFNLAPKCTVHLVRVKDMKVIVAMDGQGIKAMVPYTSFRENLNLSEERDTNDSRSAYSRFPEERVY